MLLHVQHSQVEEPIQYTDGPLVPYQACYHCLGII